MNNVGWWLKLALPNKLDFIGDIVDDLVEIALELANGFSENDERIITDKVRSVLQHQGFDTADSESVAKAAGIIARWIAGAKPFKRKRRILI